MSRLVVGVELQLSNGVFQSTSTKKRTAPTESCFFCRVLWEGNCTRCKIQLKNRELIFKYLNFTRKLCNILHQVFAIRSGRRLRTKLALILAHFCLCFISVQVSDIKFSKTFACFLLHPFFFFWGGGWNKPWLGAIKQVWLLTPIVDIRQSVSL